MLKRQRQTTQYRLEKAQRHKLLVAVLGWRMRAQEQVNIPQQLIDADICYSLRQRSRDLEQTSQNPLSKLRRLPSCKGNRWLRLVKELEQQREELVWLCGIKCEHKQALKCI